MTSPLRVAILGAGGVGLASAALLASVGHQPLLWSRSGQGLATIASEGIQARGAIEGRFASTVVTDLRLAIESADVVLVTLPANGRRQVFHGLLPLLRAGQTVIVSGDLSLGALYLHRKLEDHGVVVDVVAWATTVVMGRRIAPGQVAVGGVRAGIAGAVLPATASDRGMALCAALFGPRFTPLSGPLPILLGNLNPQVHMANVLCNLTRIEKGESWANYDGISPAVARLIEDLDRERLALGARCGLVLRSVEEHFRQSFGLPQGMTLAEMTAELHRRRGGPPGPTSLETRFITEDLPFGVAPLIRVAHAWGVGLPLHEAGLRLLSSLCGQDFAASNDLIDDVALDDPLVSARR
ncbi:MAG: NAD/NADP octopine/nopaline dehydrogenase family protein [Rhizobiaceae bacterium]